MKTITVKLNNTRVKMETIVGSHKKNGLHQRCVAWHEETGQCYKLRKGVKKTVWSVVGVSR